MHKNLYIHSIFLASIFSILTIQPSEFIANTINPNTNNVERKAFNDVTNKPRTQPTEPTNGRQN